MLNTHKDTISQDLIIALFNLYQIKVSLSWWKIYHNKIVEFISSEPFHIFKLFKFTINKDVEAHEYSINSSR